MTAIVHVPTNEFIVDGSVTPDGVTYIVVTVPRNPDPAVERYSGNAVAPFTAKTQPEIDAYAAARLNEQAVKAADSQRIIAAVVWAVIDTYSAPATVAKFNNARTKIIDAYKTQPWRGT
jgi:hypothetical protein